jgi:regulator of sigma E protease
VRPDSAALAAGFRGGDLVVSIDGRPIESFTDMQRIVSGSAERTLEIVVDRGGALVTLKAVPKLQEVKDRFNNTHRIGVLGIERSTAPGDVRTERVPPLQAVVVGVEETWFVIERTMSYLAGVIVGRESADQLGGPARIAQVAGQMASLGILPIINLAAVLSVSIGLLNLFPIPLLDGGHLLFYAVEAVRGRPLSDRAQEVGFRIGLAIVLMLMIFATFNDILRLTSS